MDLSFGTPIRYTLDNMATSGSLPSHKVMAGDTGKYLGPDDEPGWHLTVVEVDEAWLIVPVTDAMFEPVVTGSSDVTTVDVAGGQVRIWEPDALQNDLGRMYVMDVLGVSLLVREREDGTYVHVEDEGLVRKPLLVEVNNGGENVYGTD